MANRSFRFAVVALASVLFVAAQAPQLVGQAAQKIRESLSVTVVEIPVTVVDRNGNPVRGLTKANFELVDEGKKQSIDYFEEVDLVKISAEDHPETPMNPVARRNFMLLFDLSNSSPGTLSRARDASLEFVKSEVGELDLVAVATYSSEKGFRLLTGFTADGALLAAAIETMGNPKFYDMKDPLLLSANRTGSANDRGAANERGGVEQIALEELAELNQINTRSNEEFNRGRVRTQLKAFAGFARVLDRVRGRKQVVLLSEGFDARLVQGRESTGSVESRQESEAVISGQVWAVDSDQRYGNTAAANEVTTMTDLFNRSDVVLHAIDIKGLRTDVDAREGTKKSSNESLFLMTKPTGGQVFKNANDIRENFKKILRSQEVVYVLGFTAKSAGTPGKFHNLKVKIKDVPGGPRVSHRAGYYEPADKISPIEQTLTAADILQSNIPIDDVALSVLSVPFPIANDKPVVPVVVEIPGSPLLEGVSGNALTAEIFIYAFDAGGAVEDFLHQRVSLDLAKVREQLVSSGLKYYGSLRLDPGAHEIKVLVRVAESGRNGFQRHSLQVPKFDEAVAVSPVVWDEGTNQKWMMVKGRPRSAAEVDYPFQIASESFVPAVKASLQPDSSYKVTIFTYNVQKDGIDIKASVRGADGKVSPARIALLGAAPEQTKGATKLMLKFEPLGLTPGRYSLDVTLRHKTQNLNQTLAVPFEVKPVG